MRCPECKTRVPENLLLCPHCGTRVEETGPIRARRKRLTTIAVEETQEIAAITQEMVAQQSKPADASPVLRRLRAFILWGMLLVVLVGIGIGAGTWYGAYKGESDNLAQRLAAADEHYDKGVERLTAGEFELAIAEFEHVLKLNPDHANAARGIDQANEGIANRPTPTSEAVEFVASDLFQQASTHYQDQAWTEAADLLIQLRVLDASYEPQATEEMLFTSLYNAGMARLEEDRFEEGIFYLDQAVALRPLDEDTLNQRRWAVQYMTALGYWGVDWELCIERFEQLHAVAPQYKDVFQRLYRAHLEYADAWYQQEEMCPAEQQYTLALQLVNSAEVDQKRVEAAATCAVATPTPIAPIAGSQAITLTELPEGFGVGRLAYPIYNTNSGTYDVYVLSTDRRLVRMAEGADQPAWQQTTGALAYRDLFNPGLSLLAGEGGPPRQLGSGGGLAWPTFSPDGVRVAYAVQDVAGKWQINIAPLDGSAEPTVHASGKGPAWASNGWLAWTGCEASGACGIMIDNPDDGDPPTRLTASANDIGLSWSPDGGMLAYMSDVTGNWEVYQVSTGGGVVKATDDPGADGLPAWAPDGSGLAFASNRDGSWGLYLMGPNGQNPHKVLDLGPSLPNWTLQRISWGP